MKVFCELCNKPVDDLKVWTDPYRDSMIVVARCHGAEDEIHLSAVDSIRAAHAMTEITAFQQPQKVAR